MSSTLSLACGGGPCQSPCRSPRRSSRPCPYFDGAARVNPPCRRPRRVDHYGSARVRRGGSGRGPGRARRGPARDRRSPAAPRGTGRSRGPAPGAGGEGRDPAARLPPCCGSGARGGSYHAGAGGRDPRAAWRVWRGGGFRRGWRVRPRRARTCGADSENCQLHPVLSRWEGLFRMTQVVVGVPGGAFRFALPCSACELGSAPQHRADGGSVAVGASARRRLHLDKPELNPSRRASLPPAPGREAEPV